MGLWMFYVDAQNSEIEAACNAAAAELRRRQFSPELAQQAALDAADLSEDFDIETTPAADAVVAWYAAEEAACQALQTLTGEWPHDAALIFTEGE